MGVIVIAVMLSAGCKRDDSISPPDIDPAKDDLRYYPMEVGNKWEYRSSFGNHIVRREIIEKHEGTVTSDSCVFIETNTATNDTTHLIGYWDHNELLFHAPDQSPAVYLALPLDVGNRWMVFDESTERRTFYREALVIAEDTAVVVLSDTMNAAVVREVVYETRQDEDSLMYDTTYVGYVRDIGWVYQRSGDTTFELLNFTTADTL